MVCIEHRERPSWRYVFERAIYESTEYSPMHHLPKRKQSIPLIGTISRTQKERSSESPSKPTPRTKASPTGDTEPKPFAPSSSSNSSSSSCIRSRIARWNHGPNRWSYRWANMADASLERRMPLETPQARRPIIRLVFAHREHSSLFSLREPQETGQQSRQARHFTPSNSAFCRRNSLATSAQVQLN